MGGIREASKSSELVGVGRSGQGLVDGGVGRAQTQGEQLCFPSPEITP